MLKVLDVEGAVDREAALDARPGAPGLRRRAIREGHRAAAARAGRDGGLRRRRALPHAGAARGARRSGAGRLRRLRRLHRAAFAGRWTRPSCARPRCTCARGPRARRQEEDPTPRQDAQARRRRARRGRAGAGAAGRRRLGPAGAGGPRAGRFDDELVAAAAETVRIWRPRSGSFGRMPRRRIVGGVPESASRLAAAPGTGRSRPVPGAGGRQPGPARDGQLRPAGREHGWQIPRGRRRAAGRSSCCSSTTSATAARRSRSSRPVEAQSERAAVYPLALATAL